MVAVSHSDKLSLLLYPLLTESEFLRIPHNFKPNAPLSHDNTPIRARISSDLTHFEWRDSFSPNVVGKFALKSISKVCQVYHTPLALEPDGWALPHAFIMWNLLIVGTNNPFVSLLLHRLSTVAWEKVCLPSTNRGSFFPFIQAKSITCFICMPQISAMLQGGSAPSLYV